VTEASGIEVVVRAPVQLTHGSASRGVTGRVLERESLLHPAELRWPVDHERDAEQYQLDVPEVTAALSLASAGITNLKVPLQHGGTGHYLVGGFQVPLRGTWTLNITVRTSEFDEFNATPARVRMR